MLELHARHPQYGFDRHKGYATPQHLAALCKYGAIEAHRRSFAPVRVLMQQAEFSWS
jgi:ribonuclease HII